MVKIIGAGLAGCEAAWYLANNGIKVKLYEQRPKKTTPAHVTDFFGELVCSNSLRSSELTVAAGILKNEMAKLNSLIITSALQNEVPAGSALAVDRNKFSQTITEKIINHPNIEVIKKEVTTINDEHTIIASGPLTSDELSGAIKEFLGEEHLYFFDAASPIILKSSIDLDKTYLKSRYDKGEAAYLNCPLTREEFNEFYRELILAKCIEVKDFELKVFEGCMPFEVMAKRGEKTLLFGPMKPVGLQTPNGKLPYAVVQLRQDDAKSSLYNIVGFQTHLMFSEQKRILRLIPGLENVEIVRYGVMHRNTFINSPKLLDQTYQSKSNKKIFFAGQITGVEGYVESAASGINAAINMKLLLEKRSLINFPTSTAFGALSYYITHASPTKFQPMNINFGIFEDLNIIVKKKERKEAYAKKAISDFDFFLKENLNE